MIKGGKKCHSPTYNIDASKKPIILVEPLEKRKYGKPLFPVTEGSFNYETLQSFEDERHIHF